jgi:hypothetical protein
LREKALHHPSSGTRWQLSALFSLVQELSPYYDPATDQLDGKSDTKVVREHEVNVHL